MSQTNVDLVLKSYDAFNRRDWDAFVALMDDEVEIESRLVAMEGGYHGHEGRVAGGTTSSAPFPTTPSISRSCATSET